LLDPNRERLIQYLAAQDFLRRIGLFPPEIRMAQPEAGVALLEDVGDASLFHLEKGDPRKRESRRAYHAAVAALGLLAITPEEEFRADPTLGSRRFDRSALRDETRYFSREVLARFLGWTPERIAHLDHEFDALADEVSQGPYALMHRDYQSQNLHWRFPDEGSEGSPGNPRLDPPENGLARLAILDFQNLTWGPALYDLVSLVCDPYVLLSAGRRQRYLEVFRRALPPDSPVAQMKIADFQRLFWATALQRLLQASAAFVYLSRVAGKPAFAAYLQPALTQARRALWHLPELKKTTAAVNTAWKAAQSRTP
jgi:hypothetical protein